MLLEQLRDDVVRVCRELADSGLVVGTSGNVSARDGDLVANHGAVATGPDLRSALTGCRYLEWLCEVYLRALAAAGPGGPRLLPADEIALVAGQFAGYGQRRPV
jgi:L-fuculose-phosphate aldolase